MHPVEGRSIFSDSDYDYQEVLCASCLFVVFANVGLLVDVCGLQRRDRRDWDTTSDPASTPYAVLSLARR